MNDDYTELTIYVTSKCNLHCQQCVMGKFMRENAKYEMSIPELQDFLDITKRSGYVFNMIVCGGEPLLWRHLEEGMKLIHESGVANRILIFSNVIDISRVTDEVMKYTTQLRVSRYESNEKNTKELIARYPDKIRVVERREFCELPTEPVPGSLPSLPDDCLTPENLFMKDKIFACPHVASVNGGKDTLDDGTKLYVPLQIGYMDGMKQILEKQKHLCMKCISNKKIRRNAKTFKKLDRDTKFL